MGKALFRSRATLRSSLLVFLASVVFIGVFYLIWSSANAATPTVTFSRTGDEIKATASISSSYSLRYLSNSNSEQYWEYDAVASASDCNASDFVGSAQAVKVSGEDSVTFTPNPVPTTDQNYCLKVLYSRTNSQTYQEHYANVVFDVTAPEIEVSQSGLILTARSDDPSDIKIWHSYVGASDPVDCSSETDPAINPSAPSSSGSNTYALTLTTTQNDYYACFRAEDNQGNTGYSAIVVVDTVAPTLTSSQPALESAILDIAVSQDDDGDSTPDGNSDIDDASWQYALARSNVDCEDLTTWQTFNNLNGATSNQDSAQVTFRNSDRGRFYCFRVADDAGNYAYLRHEVGTINEPPKIVRLSQNKNLVTASATDAQYVNRNSWQYAVVDSSDCTAGASSTWNSPGSAGFSVNSQNQAVLDLSQAAIDESTQDRWVCFRVADNLAGNYGYRSLDIDVNPPTVNLAQNNQILTATYNSGEGAVSSTWSYVKDNGYFDCDADAFVIYGPVQSGSRVSLTSKDVNDYFCFRVADRYGNYGFSQSYQVASLDTVAPTLSARQENNYLIVSAATSEGVDNSTWQYAPGYSSRPDCDDLAGGQYDDIARTLKVELDEGDIGDWFCIRAKDASDNYGYFAIRITDVDATSPRVTVERDYNTLIASTSANDVDDDTWQYAVSQANEAFDCSHSNRNALLFNAASSQNQRVALDENDQDRYYCFRVADESDNYGYARSRKVTAVEPAPVIEVDQNTATRRLEVYTDDTDVDGTTWGWAAFSADPGDCANVSYTDIAHDLITVNTRRIYVNNIADSQDGNYYCFRVADTSTLYGLNYGYAKHRYDISQPVIRFSLSADNVLTVSASDAGLDATTWRYAAFASQPDCDTAIVGQALPAGNKILLTAADNGSWLCFRVADHEGNVANKAYAVTGIREDRVPSVSIKQTENYIIAMSNAADLDSSTWRYAISPGEPFCGPGTRLHFETSTGILNRVRLDSISTTYNWVCFKVSTTASQVGYAKIQIDRQPPVIVLAQSNAALTAESSAGDLAQDTWAYAKSATDLVCESATYTDIATSGTEIQIDLTSDDNNDYYCIRVADKYGNQGYAKTRIDPIVAQAPDIRIAHNNTVLRVSASDVDNSTWQYVRSATDVNCSQTGNLNFTGSGLGDRELILSESDNGQWFCFKVTGNNGQDGYAKVLINSVDSQRPQVTVGRQGNTLIATASESVTWHYVVLGANMNCSSRAFAGTAGRGNEVALTAADNGKTYCFRGVDAAGNAGYGEYTAVIDPGEIPDPGPVDPVTPPEVAPEDPEDPEDPETPGEEAKDDKKEGDDKTAEGDDDESFFEEYRTPLIAGVAGLIVVILVVVTVLLVNQKRQNGSDDDIDYL